MDIVSRIEMFASDIYFKLPDEIRKDYISICEELDKLFDSYSGITNQKNEIFLNLLKVMETNDFIRMADVLLYNIKPLIVKCYN